MRKNLSQRGFDVRSEGWGGDAKQEAPKRASWIFVVFLRYVLHLVLAWIFPLPFGIRSASCEAMFFCYHLRTWCRSIWRQDRWYLRSGTWIGPCSERQRKDLLDLCHQYGPCAWNLSKGDSHGFSQCLTLAEGCLEMEIYLSSPPHTQGFHSAWYDRFYEWSCS